MKKAVLLTVSVLIILSVNLYSADIPKDIQAAYDNHNYDETIEKIQEVLKKDKRNYDLYYLLGKCYQKKRDLESAIEAFDRAVSIRSKFHEARYELGQLYLQTDQLEEAKETFEKGLDKAKEDKEKAIFEDGLGLYYTKIGDYSQADIQFRKAQIKDPDNLMYILHQGDVAFDQNSYAIALVAYQKALSYDSTNAEIWFRISKCRLNQKQLSQALEAIDKTLSLDSSYTEAYLIAGNIYTVYAVTQQGNAEQQQQLFSRAILLYDRYLEMTGDSGITNYYRGKAYFALNDFENAVEDFESAARFDLDKEDLTSLIGRSYSKLKEYNKAIEALNEYEKSVLEGNPDYEWKKEDADLFYERANAYAGLADSSSRLLASEDYVRAKELDSNNAMLYYRSGINNYFLKDYDGALQDYESFLAIDSTNPGVYLNVAYSYLGMKDFDNALMYLQKALELNPEYTSAFKLIANIYFQKKDYANALDYYNKAFEVDPKDCEILKWIGIINLVKTPANPALSVSKLKAYQECLRNKGESPCDDVEIYKYIAQAYQLRGNDGDLENAFEWVKRGLKCAPNNADLKKMFEDLELEVEY